MSFFNTKNALTKVEFKGFGGIERRYPLSGKGNTRELNNFRVLADGSLVKRSGYKKLFEFSGEVRAILTGYFESLFIGYVLAGSSVYKLDFSNMSTLLVGKVGTESGRASIFYYLGHVYLCDGSEIYDVKDSGVTVSEGYAPLLGKDWGSAYPGQIHEPLNLLCKRARISYIVDDPPNTFLSTMYPVESVQEIYKNGEAVPSGEYSVDRSLRVISMQGLEAGDRVIAYVTFENAGGDRSKLVKNTESAVFGGISNSRVFMWGGEDKNRMFSSCAVSSADLRESEKVYGGSGGLYFPVDYDFSVGDGKSEIKAVSRHYGRLLIFTSEDAWMANSDTCGTDEFPAMRINAEGGCMSLCGVAKSANDPVSVSDGRILRWTSNTDELDDFNFYSISEGIDDIIPKSFYSNAVVFEDRHKGEVLFADSSDPEGRVYVYGSGTKQWYMYVGIKASRFFDLIGNIGFANENCLYGFDDTLSYDIGKNGEILPVVATFLTDPMDLGLPEGKKRLMEYCLVADTGAGELDLIFDTDVGVRLEKKLKKIGNSDGDSYRSRLNSGRFVRASMSIRSGSRFCERIFGITLTAKR